MAGKQLSNVIHIRHKTDSGKSESKIIYVENVQDEAGNITKQIDVEEDPKYTFYVTKPEFKKEITKQVNYIEMSKVDPVTVRFDDLMYNAAKASGQIPFFQACLSNGKFRELRNINKDRHLHLTDMDLPDYKTRQWLDRNRHNIALLPITKAFYDIEVDTLGHQGFPEAELAPCPVAMISYIYQPTMTIHQFLLRNPKNKSQMEFLEQLVEHREDYAAMLIEEMNEVDPNAKTEYAKVKALKFHIYDDEMDLIRNFFNLVKRDKADFVAAWNAGFDMVTLKTRILQRKVNPAKIMCPVDFPYQSVWVEQDAFSTDFRKRNTKLEVAGYSQFVELQESFAKIRATMGQRESYALDAILLDEGIEGKFEYEGSISEAMHIDYEGFMKYSVYDSFRLYQLEAQNNDIDLLYEMGLMTATRFSKVMTKTTSIRNFAAMLLEKDGFMLSNNHNRLKDEEEKVKFKGAFVALPELMDHVGVEIGNDGMRSNRIIENVVDEDLTAMYPNIILSGNIDADTMIGKIMCEDRPDLDDHIPNLLAEADYLRIGHDLLGMPNFDEIVENIEDYLT